MTGALRAEWIKLTSTRSPYWCVAVAVVVSLGFTGLLAGSLSSITDVANSGGSTADLRPEVYGAALQVLMLGVFQFAVIVLMIMATLGITSEYRFATIRSSFLAQPKRPVVLTAKALVFVALTVVITLILTVVCLFILKAGISGFELGTSMVIRQIWGIPVYAGLCMLLALGVGALIRHTAGAISLVLVWMLVIETILSSVPKVRDWVGPFLPFENGRHFLFEVNDGAFHWGPYVGLIYFAVWAVGIFAAGVLVTTRRDA